MENNKKEILKFPKDFLWGAAISSYQTEGGNYNTDWSQWEKAGKSKEECKEACDYWNRWKSDHDMLSQIGVKAFRLSIEWSRVEPEEGVFSEEALARYREILSDLRERGIRTQVTLWWWASPLWFSKKYGFHRKKSVKIFARYVEKVTEELGSFIDIWTVLNEPMVPLGQGYLAGLFPPGYKYSQPWRAYFAVNNLAKAHIESYKIIHRHDPNAQVGISYLYNCYMTEGLWFFEKIVDKIARWWRIDLLGNKIKNFQDYVGINYYRLGRMRFDPKNSAYMGFRMEDDPKNVMGWVTYAKGIYAVLKEAHKKFDRPIYILENGVPTNIGLEDNERIAFIKDHLIFTHKAIQEGVPVKGYNYWALMDNYEWLSGYGPRFGLVEVDFRTFVRTLRKSALEYAKICKSNEVKIEN